MANDRQEQMRRLYASHGDNAGVYMKSLEAMDTILKEADRDVPKLPEKLFKGVLLPALTYKGDDEKEQGKGVDYWLRIAGNSYRPIDVVDDKDQNKVLFRVPPLNRRVGTEILRRRRHQSVFQILTDAENRSKITPQQGARHIQENLINQVQHVPLALEDIKAWNDILLRYNYSPLVDPSLLTQVKSGVKNEDSGSDGNTASGDSLFDEEYQEL